MKRHIILHVGFDKVGSSSIQTYLSTRKLISDDKQYLYCCIKKDGSVQIVDVEQMAKSNLLGYASSHPNFMQDSDLGVLKNDLDKLFQKGITPIFSSEGWARHFSKFLDSSVFVNLDVQATVLFYVRPQVSWINSAWSQWFHWHDGFKNPEQYFDKSGKNAANWNTIIQKWEDVPNVSSILVRLQQEDVVKDFLSLFNIKANQQEIEKSRSNVSLSPELIKLLNQFSYVRGVHDGHVDRKLAYVLEFTEKSPWVINKALIAEVIDYFRDSNQLLLQRLDDGQKEAMEQDARWWDTESYDKKELTTLDSLTLSDKEKDTILEQLLNYILK